MWVNEFNPQGKNIFIGKWHFGNKVAFMDLYIYSRETTFITLKASKCIKNLKIDACIYLIKALAQDIQSKFMF